MLPVTVRVEPAPLPISTSAIALALLPLVRFRLPPTFMVAPPCSVMRRVRVFEVVVNVTSPLVVRLKPVLMVRNVLLLLASATEAAFAFAVTVTVCPPLMVTVSPVVGEPPAPVHPAFQVVAVPPFQLPLALEEQDPPNADGAPKMNEQAMTIAARISNIRTAAAMQDCRSGHGNKR